MVAAQIPLVCMFVCLFVRVVVHSGLIDSLTSTMKQIIRTL